MTQIFIQNVGSVEGAGEAFAISEDGQVMLGETKLLASAAYPRGLRVGEIGLDYDANTDIFSVTLRITDPKGETLAQTVFEVKRLNNTQ